MLPISCLVVGSTPRVPGLFLGGCAPLLTCLPIRCLRESLRFVNAHHVWLTTLTLKQVTNVQPSTSTCLPSQMPLAIFCIRAGTGPLHWVALGWLWGRWSDWRAPCCCSRGTRHLLVDWGRDPPVLVVDNTAATSLFEVTNRHHQKLRRLRTFRMREGGGSIGCLELPPCRLWQETQQSVGIATPPFWLSMRPTTSDSAASGLTPGRETEDFGGWGGQDLRGNPCTVVVCATPHTTTALVVPPDHARLTVAQR